MNVTLSADKDLLKRARRYARSHGTSLNQLFRDFLGELTGAMSSEEAAEEFAIIARTMAGDSGGGPWSGRDELYRERLDGKLRRRRTVDE